MTTPSKPAIYSYYENAAAKITRERAGYIRLQMLPGKQAATDIRAMFEQSMLAIQVSGFRKLLLDHRLAAPFVEEAKQWFEHAFLQFMAADATVHRVAIVRAYDVFARLSMVPLSAGVYRQGNRFRTFEGETESLAWLLDDGPASSARS